MNKEAEEKLDEIIKYFKENEYLKTCNSLKKQMEDNEEINEKIKRIKELQKLYVNSHFQDEDIKKELDTLEEELLSIPIYNEYNRNLEEINKQIEYFKEEMNHYFDEVINL